MITTQKIHDIYPNAKIVYLIKHTNHERVDFILKSNDDDILEYVRIKKDTLKSLNLYCLNDENIQWLRVDPINPNFEESTIYVSPPMASFLENIYQDYIVRNNHE